VASVGGKILHEFCEVESGKNDDRPQLAAALRLCRVHKAVLVISKIDRLSRNLLFLAQMMESGAEFCAVDMPSANRFTLSVMAALAEQEREMISQRTKLALQAARRRGTVLGGDRGKQTHSQMLAANAASAQVRSAKAAQRAADLRPVLEELRASGCNTLASLAEGLNAKGISTSRGCAWSAAQVHRILG